jgi:hypothetical protein
MSDDILVIDLIDWIRNLDTSILGASRIFQRVRFEHTYLNGIRNSVHDTRATYGTSRSNVMSYTVYQ